MKELYQVKGSLNHGFVGQIAYTVCLPCALRGLDIALVFGKQRYPSLEEAPVKELCDYCEREYGLVCRTEEELRRAVLYDMKTEIHLMAELNGEFIGCIHKQLTERHMRFTKDELSEGCTRPAALEGVLKVTVLVFNVLMDDTPYSVTVAIDK